MDGHALQELVSESSSSVGTQQVSQNCLLGKTPPQRAEAFHVWSCVVVAGEHKRVSDSPHEADPLTSVPPPPDGELPRAPPALARPDWFEVPCDAAQA